jgi:MFS transporter, DHA1 family, inner membrane transport protein
MRGSGTAASPADWREGLALGALGLGSFVIGTAELVVAGLLNKVAASFAVPTASAGHLVTAYALGICVGGPLLAALTSRAARRALLLATVAAYAAGTVVVASASSFGVLLAARAATGALHGLFIGVATVVAAGLVAPGRRGRAMGMVFGGIAVSTVVGAPLGTLVGQSLGWRATFWAIAALAGLALAAMAALVPASRRRAGPARGTRRPLRFLLGCWRCSGWAWS